MYLERIKVRNFRCFNDNGIVANFRKGVNVIVGENNTGKSALIDALRIAFSAAQYQREIFFRKLDFHVDATGKTACEAQFDLYFAEVPMELIDIWMPDSGNRGEFHMKFHLTGSGDEKVKCTAWGGSIEGNHLSEELFDAIDVSYLGALRNAEAGLRPARNSKLATLLSAVANTHEKRQELIGILSNANKQLLCKEQVRRVREIINHNLDSIEQDILSQQIDIGFTEPRFEAIAGSIRSWINPKWSKISREGEVAEKLVELAANPSYSRMIRINDSFIFVNITELLQKMHKLEYDDNSNIEEFLVNCRQNFELVQNGLGYNNLIYMSTTLGDMSIQKEGVYQSMLLVEEPEAHLHPQLQDLIYTYFQRQQRENKNLQILFTTHSPTLVSKVDLDQINLLYEKDQTILCMPMAQCEAAKCASDKAHLMKYLDVTKSQMFFAKGLIFVEGISEALLLPAIAKALGRPFDRYAVEVINIDSLAFKPFIHLLCRTDGMPAFCKATIVTDDDRCNEKDENYISLDLDFDNDVAGLAKKLNNSKESERFLEICKMCKKANIQICGAKKTLEYELAFCDENIGVIVDILKKLYPSVGTELKNKVDQYSSTIEKQIAVWLFIRKRNKCKADLAQEISELILRGNEEGKEYFCIPEYLKQAVYYVTEPIMEEIEV